jgi:hypothetical protein
MKLVVSSAATLLECMVYLGCSSLLALTIFTFSSQTYHYFINVRKQFCATLQLELALDAVKRDLFSATRFAINYVPEHCIFKKEFIDAAGNVSACFVGWECHNNGLARVEGDYDIGARRWRRRVVSKLPARVASLHLLLVRDEQSGDITRCCVLWSLVGDKNIYKESCTIGAEVV